MIYKAENMEGPGRLFAGWQETLIWSCLQGVMGDIYVDDREHPSAAMALLGDFCFFAGRPSEEMVRYKPGQLCRDFVIMVPQNDGWSELIEECYKEKAKKVTRHAIKKEPEVFSRERLWRAAEELPPGYSLRLMDEELYYRCRKEAWCRDLVSQYKDYETYRSCGLGVVIVKDGELVSGASSYSSYEEGIEIEIDTKEEYRRKGLSYACGARLILECLKRGLYPSWDAHNQASAALAQKLGYHYDHAYTAYEIWGY